MEIEVVAVYRVKGDRRKFRTYNAAVNRLSWLMVFEKYGDKYESFGTCWLGEIGGEVWQPKPVFSKPCKCSLDANPMEPYKGCPIHDRENGYLRRLHTRLVRYIMAMQDGIPRLAQLP